MALYKSVYYYYFFTPVLNFQEMKKITLCNAKKYQNEAGMNLTAPLPSQYYFYYFYFYTPGSIDPRG